MLKAMAVEIKGMSPLILNSSDQVNPFNQWTAAKKKITAKKKKTDEDLQEIARLEFHGALYVNEKGKIIIPGVNLEASIRDGAKKDKRGKEVQCGLSVPDDAELIYDGPKEAAKLWDVESFRYIKAVRMQAARVMKCRPIFRSWSLKFGVTFDTEVFNPDDVLRFLTIAGTYCGVGDYRPRFGRFQVA